MSTPAQDVIVEAVREKLLQRSNVGMKKYGHPISDEPGGQLAAVNHALEEALDLANYLMWLKMQMEGKIKAV